jgi:tetratricopeptide (TPR) repeat protein
MSSECNESKKQLFDRFDKKIDELYAFRDKYYILNPDSLNLEERNRDLLAKLSEFNNELESVNQSEFDSISNYLVLIGKAFNVLPDYNQKAFDSLTKAIKLDPKSVQAWNYLGECYWKKKDFLMCKNCFEQSLNIQKNKTGLRGMSMVMRQLVNVPINKEQFQKSQNSEQLNSKYDHVKNLLEESIRYAKDAVQLDAKDGMSWYILANCYVAKFFSPFGQKNASLLKQAITSYNLALKDETVLQSDLYFNKSMISMYEENWTDVLFCLSKALTLEPHWTDVKENLKGVLHYLSQLSDLVSHNGKLKAKRFQNLVESINRNDLGPYMDGYQLVTRTLVAESQEQQQVQKIQLVESKICNLEKGLNANKVLVGKVICGLLPKYSDNLNLVCFTCCIADSNGDCAVLTIYNLASGHGVIIGDSVAVPEPWLEKVGFKYKISDIIKNESQLSEFKQFNKGSDELSFKFDSIRIENPTVLVVNGKKWTREKVSSTFFVPKAISD